MKKQLQTFLKYRFLLENLISRDLKVKYRRSVLGLCWSILNPLLMMLIITAVFSTIFRFEVENFSIYYLTGWLIFNFVSESTTAALQSIVDSATLIKKVYIPKYIFPLEKVLFSFVNMFFSMIAVAIMIVATCLMGNMQLTWTMLLFPVPMLYALVFCIGFGMLIAAVNVFFRDMGHLYSVCVTAWMYLTPIIYPMEALDKAQWVLPIIKCNPLYYYVTYFRDVVMYNTVPGLAENLICIGFSLVFLLLGGWVFKRTQDKFILHI